MTQGAEFVADEGMRSIRAAAKEGSFTAFGAMAGGYNRYETGSHVDVEGFSLAVGTAGRINNLTLAGFVEAGWASSESHVASTEADASSESTEQADAPAETLIFGTSADYAPFEFMYPDDNGDMVYGGIDVSVAKYIADEMGLTLQVENMGFDYLLTSLDKGDFDIVLAAMEATPDRLENADFSDPYYTDVPPAILVKADKADQYKTLADLNGKSVGAQTATTKLDMVNEMEGVTPVALQSVLDLVNELVYDKVDAILVDGGVAKEYAASNPDLVIADASAELGEATPYCVAVAKGDPKGLLPAINAAIAKMNEANMLETFIADAGKLADVAVNVTAD